jgi:hypothetical protein
MVYVFGLVAEPLFFIIPASAIVAAFLGWRALASDPPSWEKLKTAYWWLAVPWIVTLVFGGLPFMIEEALEGEPLALSPFVAVALAVGWWWRRPSDGSSDPPKSAGIFGSIKESNNSHVEPSDK